MEKALKKNKNSSLLYQRKCGGMVWVRKLDVHPIEKKKQRKKERNHTEGSQLLMEFFQNKGTTNRLRIV